MSITQIKFPYIDGAALFDKVAQQEWSIYLDSGVVSGHAPVTRNADYDVLAIEPRVTLVCQASVTTISTNSHSSESMEDPLELIKNHLVPNGYDGLPSNFDVPYMPGALGYFSYDLARRFEDLPDTAEDDQNLPEMAIGIYDVVVVIDHVRKCTSIVARTESIETEELIEKWQNLIESQLTDTKGRSSTGVQKDRLKSSVMSDNMDLLKYQRCFNKVRDYTIEGDCYQVNLTKRFSAEVEGDAWQTYLALRAASPAPYGCFINLPFAQVLSNSPESFIQCRQQMVTTSPIKGTMPRDHDDLENDKRIAEKLANSEKDRAENLMIVDLMRNDLSRCCEHGSVQVPKLFALHSFANVHHLISTVTGTLLKGLHSLDLLRSCFPGGSITGAPKIRAMQIIEELEPHRRGLYCGSIAYVGYDGSLETNIAIRTIVVKNGVARFSAGGGLVIDSELDSEYQEIKDKARMMNEALMPV